MDINALNKVCCGLFVLTASDENGQNGCIINTVMQVTSSPVKISVTVNKSNYTTDMILKTKKFNISCLDETAEFDLFKTFGFSSGRTNNKFADFKDFKIAPNKINYITRSTNAYICAEVTDTIDVGTHYIFIAEVTDAEVLSVYPSASYAYYHSNIKPAPAENKSEKNRWVCTICGYVYEGDELPDDFICPLCKHPASDFKKM